MDADTFLSLMEIPSQSGKFALCPFDPGITLLKQQTRARNLLFALRARDKLKKGCSILVIGGGVAGVTAASAAAKLGCKVTLLERLHTLVHLQNGCDTRWLHPHIYEWPAGNSHRVYAELPILDWRAGSASNVAKQILMGFLDIQRKAGDSLEVHTGVSITDIEGRKVSWGNRDESHIQTYDLIIFAVGFGIERNMMARSLSYWRNDSLHQSDPKADPNCRTTCLISGTGDGGLIDLMRATLSDFNHETVHHEFFADLSADVLARLLCIKADWKDTAHQKEDGWLHDKYNSLLEEHLLDSILSRIDARRRKDTDVTLNGQKKGFNLVLSLDSASMFSTLVAFCLFSCAAFKYLPGEFSAEKGNVKIGGRRQRFNQVVIRHGSGIAEAYASAHCPEVISIFNRGDELRKYLKSADRLWPAGWWDQDSSNGEYVSRPTCVLATTFVSTLRDVVELTYNRQCNKSDRDSLEFRITMHRLTKVQGRDFFQQIARYAGTETRLKGKVGRVFPVTTGLGGLCCRIRRPVKIMYKGESFGELRRGLEIDQSGARPINDNVKSFLTVPFFATPVVTNGPAPMVLLLYADSNRADFFSETVLETIYSACRGFVGHVEGMIKQAEIFFSPADSNGFVGEATDSDNTLIRDNDGIMTDSSIFDRYKKDLTFKHMSYFEVSHQA